MGLLVPCSRLVWAVCEFVLSTGFFSSRQGSFSFLLYGSFLMPSVIVLPNLFFFFLFVSDPVSFPLFLSCRIHVIALLLKSAFAHSLFHSSSSLTVFGFCPLISLFSLFSVLKGYC